MRNTRAKRNLRRDIKRDRIKAGTFTERMGRWTRPM